MDFFETREKYRRKEVQVYTSWIIRFFALSLALWLGWQWGSIEQRRLQADADLEIYENNVKIQSLNIEKERLEHELKLQNAENQALMLTSFKKESKLTRLVKEQISKGTKIEQIYQMLQGLGQPLNCRNILNEDIAVATELYSGVESNINLFGGGLRIFVEGISKVNGSKNDPWFDPTREIKVKYVYLGSQKIVKGKIPLNSILPAEDWLISVDIVSSDIKGYAKVSVNSCNIR